MTNAGHIPSLRSTPTLLVASALLLAMLPGLSGCAWVEKEQVRRSMNRGQEKLEANDLDAALAEFEKAVELDPELAPAHSHIGRIQVLKGNLIEAGKAFSTALRLNPESYTDAFSLAEVYQQLKQFVDAIKAYRYALRINPDDPQAHLNLGMCFHEMGELSDAIASYEHVLELDPDSNVAHVNIGAAYDSIGDYYNAIHAYYEALERDPHQPMVLVNLATSLIKQERFATAREALRKAIEVDPALGVAYERMAYCCFRERDYDEAFKHYEWAATLDPKNAQAYTGMGIVCMARHLADPDRRELRRQAVEYWHRSLELNPQQQAVRKLVDKYRIPPPAAIEVGVASSHVTSKTRSERASSPEPDPAIAPSPFREEHQRGPRQAIAWTPQQWQDWIDRVRYQWSKRDQESSRTTGQGGSAPGSTEENLMEDLVNETQGKVGTIPSRLANVFAETWPELSIEKAGPSLPQALLHVMKRQDREAALFLLALNPALDEADENGRTPLHLAAANGWLDVVEKLLDREAPINVKDIQGHTAMHLAALHDHARVLERLIAGGAMVNVADNEGRTPLHLAAHDGRLQAVEVLAPKSLINALDRQGRSPARLARDEGHEPVLTTLREWGGTIIPEAQPSDNKDVASTAK